MALYLFPVRLTAGSGEGVVRQNAERIVQRYLAVLVGVCCQKCSVLQGHLLAGGFDLVGGGSAPAALASRLHGDNEWISG